MYACILGKLHRMQIVMRIKQKRSIFERLSRQIQLIIDFGHLNSTSIFYNVNLKEGPSEMTQSEPTQLYLMCQKSIGKFNLDSLIKFSKSLFPCMAKADPIASIESSLVTFFTIKIHKSVPFAEVSSEIIKKAKDVSQEFHDQIKDMVESNLFTQLIRDQIFKTNNPPQIKSKSNEAQTDDDTKIIDRSEVPNLQSSNSAQFPSMNHRQVGNKNLSVNANKNKNTIMTKISVPQSNFSLANKPQNGQSSNINLNNNNENTVINLIDRAICLCGKEINPFNETKQRQFTCIHCHQAYHNQCMKKKDLGVKEAGKSCSICHLQKMLPNQFVQKALFIGLLKKSKRKHEISMPLTQEELQNRQYKLQVRCFRLKEETQISTLFPDAIKFTVNSIDIKETLPLHRQSSLKYRKDEPFYLDTKNLFPKNNKIILTERFPSKDTKQERIQPENHLLGIFLVEDKKTEALVEEIKFRNVSDFQESRKLLERAFRIGSSSSNDEIICEVVKIPLTCTLTIDQIKIPVRGILCTHYQCFDLTNYLKMISQAANPRWLCPLCRLPAYEFKIDCIIKAILDQYHKCGANEVMFFKTGEFTVYANDEICSKEKINRIEDLPIQSRGKRIPEELNQNVKNRKSKNSSPETADNVEVIELD